MKYEKLLNEKLVAKHNKIWQFERDKKRDLSEDVFSDSQITSS